MTPASARSALARRAFSELRDALAARPARLAALWPALTPLERAACWRLLPSSGIAAAMKALPAAARWEAYLASSVDCVAPYLEDSPLGARKLFRAPTRREAALLLVGIRE
ncbi:MAG: hypothetical protein COV48_16300 [Elusimicrobia bacterium CG11_big_fil_rev_8_21_14_0_20_64_6]|nr:MAG: hypothetical protein COV48_16300 [Elusimicrobia bacterium CG11_big_fil_rev_8_21_14_0_20_64_6]